MRKYMDEMDIALESAMPYTRNREWELFNQMKNEELAPKSSRRIWRYLQKNVKQTIPSVKHPAFRVMQQIAIVFLVIMSIGFTCVLSVDAVREELWGAVLAWYEEYIAIQFTPPVEAPTFLEVRKEPTAVPKEWVKTIVIDNDALYVINYSQNDKMIVYYTQMLQDKDNIKIDESFEKIKDVSMGDKKGILLKNDKQNRYYICVWDNHYSYMIEGRMDMVTADELLKIAESIE